MHATYNITNNRLKFYIERRLDDQEYKTAKSFNFQWWPGQKCFSTVWTPQGEDFILQYCTIEEDDTPDDLEARVKRFQSYAENDERDAVEASNRITNTTRQAEQAERTAVKKLDEAAYWNRRIAGAISRAQHSERPDVIARRIKGLEADKRKQEKLKIEHEKFIKLWNNPDMQSERALFISGYDNLGGYFCFPPEKYQKSKYAGERSIWSALNDDIITAEEAQKLALQEHNKQLVFINRWIDHLTMRIDYEKAYLNAIGGNPSDAIQDIKKGDYVIYRGEKCQVLNTGKANLRILIPSNHWQKNGMLVSRENLKHA